MKKAKVIKMMTREINGCMTELIKGREEISRGLNNEYGVNWKFTEVTKEEFLNDVEEDKKLTIVITQSNKVVEVNKNNIDNFIL